MKWKGQSQKDNKENKRYLVAIPRGAIMEKASFLQKKYARRYGVYREPYPPLHLTVGIIPCPPERLPSLVVSLQRAVTPFLPLQIYTEGVICFPEPHRSINLSVRATPSLIALSRAVIRAAAEAELRAESFEGWDYHIGIVNASYAEREWSEEEYREACRLLSRELLVLEGSVHRLELWEPGFPPLSVLARFTAS